MCSSSLFSFAVLLLVTRRMKLSKCGRDTSSKACIFAISSAISPVLELLGVRHAASGSAATNPRGTIKLHLNNVSDGVRWNGTRVEEKKRAKRHGWEERSELHRYGKRLGQNGRGDWGKGTSPGRRDRVNNNCWRKVGVSSDPVWISSYRPNSSAGLWRSLNTKISTRYAESRADWLKKGRIQEGCLVRTGCGF